MAQRQGGEGLVRTVGWRERVRKNGLTVWRLGIMKRLFINTCFEWREDAEMVEGLF